MPTPLAPALLSSPAFLVVALIAGRATRDQTLERLASARLAAIGITVSFHRPPSPGPTPSSRPRRRGRRG